MDRRVIRSPTTFYFFPVSSLRHAGHLTTQWRPGARRRVIPSCARRLRNRSQDLIIVAAGLLPSRGAATMSRARGHSMR